jgi:aminopeptidase N
MEYPMCTLILGEGKLEGLASTAIHEIAHSWYQMTLASNEALNAWMDEGFADFACDETIAAITNTPNDHAGSYKSYFTVVNNNLLEAPNQHSDHFITNRGYRTGSYVAGALFLNQMRYIIGDKNLYAGLKRYYNTWKFRHPEPNDFVRVMEKTSGLQLHWYLRYWINSNKKIDYEIKEVTDGGERTNVTLARIGEMPMPIDLTVTYKDGVKEMFYIPLNEMMGGKPVEDTSIKREELTEWRWVDPTYQLTINKPKSSIALIEIDPSQRMADINKANNKWVQSESPNSN